MQKEKLFELLNACQKYFPVGLKGLRDSYPGHWEAKQIVESKINGIISGKTTPWQYFIEELKSEKSYDVKDLAYLQFPSYVCRVILEEQETDRFIFERTAVLVLSLLTPHYTIYFEDQYRIKATVNKPIFKIFHLNKLEASTKLTEIFSDLKARLEVHFEDMTYVSHYWLFKFEVEAAFPFNAEATIEQQKAPLFSLLFNGIEILDFTEILE